MFSGYGPLSTFSAKIEIAYAFDLFEADMFRDLKAIKDIRNAFAHSKDVVHFGSTSLQPLFQKLTDWTKDTNPKEIFVARIKAAMEIFQDHIQRRVIADLLLQREMPFSTWPERSP